MIQKVIKLNTADSIKFLVLKSDGWYGIFQFKDELMCIDLSNWQATFILEVYSAEAVPSTAEELQHVFNPYTRIRREQHG